MNLIVIQLLMVQTNSNNVDHRGRHTWASHMGLYLVVGLEGFLQLKIKKNIYVQGPLVDLKLQDVHPLFFER